MATMNSFDRTNATPSEYRPILRPQQAEEHKAPGQPECCCPDFCELDHGN